MVIPLVALLLQYARRRTAVARTLLLAVPVALVVLVLATPSSALFAHYYAAALPGSLQFNDGELYQQPADGTIFRFNKKVHLRLPVSLQGLPANASIHVSHAKVALDAPGMPHYDSGWLPAANTIGANGAVMPLDIIVPAAIYDRIADTPVALHITLGAEQSGAEGAGYNVTATTASFPVPHGGACHLTPNGDMICAYAIHTPSGLAVRGDAAISCAADAPAGGPRMPVSGALMPSPNLPSIDAVSIGKVMFLGRARRRFVRGRR